MTELIHQGRSGTATSPPPSTGTAGHPRRWQVLAVMCVSLIVITIDTTILNVALPAIQRSLDPSAGQLQWIVDAYTVVFAGLLLTAGALGDRFGRRGALAAGLAVFAAASVAAAGAVAGGVGANLLLRRELAARFQGRVHYPRLEYCTDNGAMIAVAGALRLADATEATEIRAVARWSLETLRPPAAA